VIYSIPDLCHLPENFPGLRIQIAGMRYLNPKNKPLGLEMHLMKIAT
jgi:hypothetical protein